MIFIGNKCKASLLLSMFLIACNADKPEKLISAAQGHIEQKDFRTAVIELKNALRAQPDSPLARYLLGSALLSDGDALTAEVELRKALDLHYPEEKILPLLARSLLEQGQAKKVVELFSEKKFSDVAVQIDLQTSVGIALASLNKTAEGTARLEKVLELQPDYVPAVLALAHFKAMGSDLAGAQRLVEQKLEKIPNNVELIKLRGDLLHAQGKIDEAERSYLAAISVQEGFVPAYQALVVLALVRDNKESAAKYLQVLKKLSPGNLNTQYLDARFLIQSGSLKEAKEIVVQLLKQVPGNGGFLELAGLIEFRLDSLTQADNYLTRALQADPALIDARRVLLSICMRTGQLSKAQSLLQSAGNQLEKNPAMLTLAGQIYLQSGELQKAESYFVKAFQLDPKDVGKRTSLAVARLLKGNEFALGELTEIATSDSGTVADLALISATMRRKEYDKALQAIARLEKKQPDNPQTFDLKGRVLLAKRQNSEARASFEAALKLNPTYMPAVSNLAKMDVAENKPAQAKQRYETVLTRESANVSALTALVEIAEKNRTSDPQLIDRVGKAVGSNPTSAALRVLLANLHLLANDPKKAVAVAQEGVTAMPDAPDLYEVLGRAQHTLGDNFQAIKTFNTLASLQSDSPLPQLRLAQVYLASNDRDSAERSLRKALEIKPDLFEAQRGLALLDMDSGNSAGALAIARGVQKQRPDQIFGYLLEGDIAVAKRSWDVAAAAYRAGLKSAPSIELAVKLTKVLIAGGKQAEADRFAADWLAAHPKDVSFRLFMGDVALAGKQNAVAIDHFKQALLIQPDNVLALNNLASLIGAQQIDQALAYAEKANKLAPDQAPIMDTLALLLVEKGETRRALELIQRAVAQQPKVGLYRLTLAKILIKTGDKVAARKELESLSNQGDHFSGQVEVARLLKSL